MLIHSILLALEEQLQQRGELPPHLNLQMDKGPENSNHVVIAMLAYLVAIRVFRSILLTFSMNGHSHNDQDGIFGVIVSFLSKCSVYTPQELAELINVALYGNRGASCAHHVPVVVDYEDLLKGCVADFTQ
jgi:hypothetical protein